MGHLESVGQAASEAAQTKPGQRMGRDDGQTGRREQKDRSEMQPPLGQAN